MTLVQSTQNDKSHFLTAMEKASTLPAPAWVKSIRENGAARFAEMPLPSRRMEEWRFTNVNPILRTAFVSPTEPAVHGLSASDVAPFLLGGSDWTTLVFVNGFYAPALSRSTVCEGVIAANIAQALDTREAELAPCLNAVLNGSGGVFGALNSAFLIDGAYIRIEPGRKATSPIHLVYITTRQECPAAHHPRNLIVAGRDSESVVIESYVNLGGDAAYLNNVVTEAELQDGARLQFYKVLHEAPNGYHLSAMKVRQHRDSNFKSFSIFLGGNIARNELSVLLDGEGAETLLNGLYLAQNEELIDNYTHIEHAKPHCSSYIGYKGVLADKSHSVFTGKVFVRPHAQKTDSNQLNQNLLLSDKATADTKPQLEIYADDVKCTHGATIGQHEPQQIYYFRTRGIAEDMARAMLTYGFADEVVRELEVEPLRKYLEKSVFDRYSPIEA
ncbi:MAG: Fe-S cluster assembly protein SufD [Candidatus Hydrogenedentota bacterium]